MISPIYRGDARVAMTMHVDVSAMQRDPLTKSPNRALFDGQLDFALASAEDRNGRVGLLLVDMNNLKVINDRYGHAVGDCAIRSTAKCLTQVYDQHGLVARIGGDEFGVVLTRAPDDVSARRLQNQFEECMNEQSCSDEPTPSMSASFGVALWPEDGDKAAALLRTADQRMYANKHRRQIA
ncbi:MAG: GGDEF domain-containing protein [Methyloceanibacter sp.]